MRMKDTKDQIADFLMWLKYDKEYYIVRYLGESIFDDWHEQIDIQDVMNEYLSIIEENRTKDHGTSQEYYGEVIG